MCGGEGRSLLLGEKGMRRTDHLIIVLLSQLTMFVKEKHNIFFFSCVRTNSIHGFILLTEKEGILPKVSPYPNFQSKPVRTICFLLLLYDNTFSIFIFAQRFIINKATLNKKTSSKFFFCTFLVCSFQVVFFSVECGRGWSAALISTWKFLSSIFSALVIQELSFSVGSLPQFENKTPFRPRRLFWLPSITSWPN